MSEPSHDPTPVASGLAVLVAAGSAGLLASMSTQLLAVGGTVVGVTVLVASGRYPEVDGQSQFVESVLAVVGLAVVVGSAAWAISELGTVSARLELVTGLLGITLVGLGVRPISHRFARRFVSAGLAALVVGVALTGLLQRATPLALLTATAGAILAWDVAEHGISLGEQLRTDARTWPVELTHAGVTAVYGGLLVGVATLLYGDGDAALPLGALVLLLAAAVTLMAVSYR
jgi:hypothetical protein